MPRREDAVIMTAGTSPEEYAKLKQLEKTIQGLSQGMSANHDEGLQFENSKKLHDESAIKMIREGNTTPSVRP